MRTRFRLPLALVVGLALAGLARAAWNEPPTSPALEDAQPSGPLWTGRDIYERVLRNRFRSYVQSSVLVSGDRGGSEQESRLRVVWKSFQEGSDLHGRGVLSKTLVKYTHPFDLRYSGYLIIHNQARANDQFLYLASSRRIRRVNLRGEAIFGTDFTFEDLVPRELEDAQYRRLPDVLVEHTPCYVVEVIPSAEVHSQYSRLVVSVEKQHFVPLRTRYWDTAGVEVKELRARKSEIRELDGVWMPMLLTMRNLQLDTYTILRVEDLDANPPLPARTFDLRRLESH